MSRTSLFLCDSAMTGLMAAACSSETRYSVQTKVADIARQCSGITFGDATSWRGWRHSESAKASCSIDKVKTARLLRANQQAARRPQGNEEVLGLQRLESALRRVD